MNPKKGDVSFPILSFKLKFFYFVEFLIICTIILGVFSSQAIGQTYPNKKILLSDWGLSHSSEIGYVRMGLLHAQGKESIIIYDIGKSKPILKDPAGPRGKTPSFSNNFYIVDQFNQGNVNKLGGYFNGFARVPSKSNVSIEKSPDGTPGLAFTYKNKKPGFSGFWIHLFDFKSPPSQRKYFDTSPFSFLTFSIYGIKGKEQIQLRMADRIWEKKEDSLLIENIESFIPEGAIQKKWQQVWVPLSKLPKKLNRKELASVVFQVKGEGESTILIKDLAFSQERDISIPSPPITLKVDRPIRKAMWLWETNKILNSEKESNQLLDFCQKEKITDLFVQIPYEAQKNQNKWEIDWDSKNMRSFISRLHKNNIKTHALDGDPRFALREWHGRVLALIERIAQYNERGNDSERFYGIRFDIEPYLLPSFVGVNKENKLKEYLELLEKSKILTKNSNLVLGVDIPFWFDSRNIYYEPTAAVGGRPVSEHIIDIVDNIGIMDYRTVAYGADGVIAHGSDELRYAEKKGKKVFIGLETVPLPNETIFEFTQNGRGKGSQIILETIDDQHVQVSWIPPKVNLPKSDSQILKQISVVNVPSSKITFDKLEPKDLRKVLQHIRFELQKYSSFYGIVIHSYESYRPWLERQEN